jgi:hypothetical protein
MPGPAAFSTRRSRAPLLLQDIRFGSHWADYVVCSAVQTLRWTGVSRPGGAGGRAPSGASCPQLDSPRKHSDLEVAAASEVAAAAAEVAAAKVAQVAEVAELADVRRMRVVRQAEAAERAAEHRADQ